MTQRSLPDDPPDDQWHALVPAGYRPRRDPAATAPKISDQDRPDPAQLRRLASSSGERPRSRCDTGSRD